MSRHPIPPHPGWPTQFTASLQWRGPHGGPHSATSATFQIPTPNSDPQRAQRTNVLVPATISLRGTCHVSPQDLQTASLAIQGDRRKRAAPRSPSRTASQRSLATSSKARGAPATEQSQNRRQAAAAETAYRYSAPAARTALSSRTPRSERRSRSRSTPRLVSVRSPSRATEDSLTPYRDALWHATKVFTLLQEDRAESPWFPAKHIPRPTNKEEAQLLLHCFLPTLAFLHTHLSPAIDEAYDLLRWKRNKCAPHSSLTEAQCDNERRTQRRQSRKEGTGAAPGTATGADLPKPKASAPKGPPGISVQPATPAPSRAPSVRRERAKAHLSPRASPPASSPFDSTSFVPPLPISRPPGHLTRSPPPYFRGQAPLTAHAFAPFQLGYGPFIATAPAWSLPPPTPGGQAFYPPQHAPQAYSHHPPQR